MAKSLGPGDITDDSCTLRCPIEHSDRKMTAKLLVVATFAGPLFPAVAAQVLFRGWINNLKGANSCCRNNRTDSIR